MARNRQKAKQRRARREQQGPKPVGKPVEARDEEASQAGIAPPQDSGATNTEAVDVKDIKRGTKDKAKDKSSGTKSTAAAKAEPKVKQRGRFAAFLRSSWAELRRVQWPDRKQMTTMSSIVIGFVFLAGAYLGAIDYVANKLVNLII